MLERMHARLDVHEIGGARFVASVAVVAYIGIGANIGSPVEQCREAVRRLGTMPGITSLRTSSLYRTEPVGPKEQAWFINAVAELKTEIPSRKLFEILKTIEKLMGRTEGMRWGPRVIDLDLLLYGQAIIDEEGLTVPHPELHKRRFVLEPLCEIASYTVHPLFNVSMRGLLDRLSEGGGVELYGKL
ncbi:MAG: 2-amino-4-hydroxy-6-hydroxymethyldihydropteridine diphosphokinase [Syntrophales bacterium]|nr:2-amino-4-hydroxy-6-hydroxymethyldihydropteridine diphosphokinase [Syntrophales bacterium]